MLELKGLGEVGDIFASDPNANAGMLNGGNGVYYPSTGGSDSIYGGGYIQPSVGSSINWANTMSSISSSFSNIFKAIQPVPQGCTQVSGPYGVSTQCLAPGQASTLSLSSAASSLGLSSSTLLLLVGGVVVIMIVKK